MPKCDNCGSTIIFGGEHDGQLRFCNKRCMQSGALASISRQIPDNLVDQQVWSVHQGRCPACNGPGPVDVHVSHRVWSALVLTSWNSRPRMSCRACGVKSQIADSMFSLSFGWWGFPWGLVYTPIQIGRNIAGLVRGPDPAKPSPQLVRSVRLAIAAQFAQPQGPRPDA